MSKFNERKRQWPNMVGLIQQANADHEALKDKIGNLSAISEVEADISSIFPRKYLGHAIKFKDIYPQTSSIIVRKYKLEKGIFAYQIIWNPDKKDSVDEKIFIPYSTRSNEIISLTKNDIPIRLASLQSSASTMVYTAQNRLLDSQKNNKADIKIDADDINFKLASATRSGYTYNKELGIYNPVISFHQMLSPEEENETFLRKFVRLEAGQIRHHEYQNIAQLNTSENNCTIETPDSYKTLSQAQIEKWVISNAVSPEDYTRLMEMVGYFISANESSKLVKAIRR